MRTTQTLKLQTQTNFASMQNLPLSGKTFSEEKKSEVHVHSWVDYSQKYGLGYLLTDGCIGVHFNDLTKIIFNPKAEVLDYIDSKNDKVVRYTLDSCPKDKEMTKKITLLQHFRTEL